MNARAAKQTAAFPRWWLDCGCVAAILLLSLLIYRPALNGELLWDDPAHVTRADLQSTEGLQRIWFEFGATQEYYPVLHTAFWVQHRLWGESTTPYHVTNVALHALNCCLLAFVLRRLWSRDAAAAFPPARPAPRMIPEGTEWLAAFLLAVHPVCVESVAWITEQKNTLSTAFYLLSALCYLDFAKRRRIFTYAIALGCFILALGAKTMTVTLPAALLVVVWWKQGKLDWRRDVVPLLPWVLVAMAAGLLTVWFESTWVGAAGAGHDLPLFQRGLLAARIFWFSLSNLVWPANLTFFYERWNVAAESTGWIAHALAILAVTAVLWFFRHRSRGALAAWLLYAGTLFPVLGFFNVFGFSFSYVADHFQYLAIPVVLAAISAAFTLGLQTLPPEARWAGRSFAVIIVALLAMLTHRQSGLYRNNEALFRANIEANPGSWMGHHILAHTLAQSPENRAESIALYRKALQLKEENPDSHYKLGIMLAERPDTRDEAVAHYREALRLRPDFAEAHNSLAVELVAMPDRLHEAISHYRRAIELRPRFAYAHANLAQALAQTPGGQTEALEHFEVALRILPNYATAHYHLANLLASLPDRLPEAASHYRAALQQRPDAPEAHFHLGRVLAQMGQVADAVVHYEKALRLQPGSADVHAFLAHALTRLPDRRPDAVVHYETALKLDPKLSWVHYNLAVALAEHPERLADAIMHCEAALRSDSDSAEGHNLLGVLQARNGRTEEAIAHWNRALEINSRFEPARRNLRLIEAAR